MRWWMGVLVGACMGPGAGGAVSAQTRPVIVVDASRSVSVSVSREDSAWLIECIDAEEEQAKAIEGLTEGAIARIRLIKTETQRAQRRLDPRSERGKWDEAQRKGVEAEVQAERAWLEDCKALVMAGQEDGWRRFELGRRRLGVVRQLPWPAMEWSGMVLGLSRAGAGGVAGMDEDTNEELKAILLRWEQETSPHVEKWMAELEGLDWNKLKGDDRAKKDAVMKEVRLGVGRASLRARRAIMGTLDGGARRVMLYSAARRYRGGLAVNLANEPVVREVLQVEELTPERRDAVLAFANEAQGRMDVLLESAIADIDQAYLAREDAGAPRDKVDAAAEKVRKERVKFEEDLLAFLTPEERAGYERVPAAEREAGRREGAEEWRWGDVRELPGVR